ncbi:MAG: N-acetylmuramoyl-L-alanine amidase [Anaerolineales bacterium]|nr:N-acetylmuramoyl-L-alanine amidase [Anaerolineales bacterium]
MESTNQEQPTPLSSNPIPQPVIRPARRPQTVNAFFSTLWVAVLIATLFTAWTPSSLFSSNLQEQLRLMLTPQPGANIAATPQPQLRIGIVAGHNGNDSGTVCLDENGAVTVTEAEVNLKIATLVKDALVAKGFQVDLLNEFDTRLNGYRAVALVSIHNDSCEYVNDEATGFKVASSMDTRDINRAQRLTACLTDRYKTATGLTFHAGSITGDMREYHAFSEIDPNTITAIIETGFMNLDQEILTKKTDLVAKGVTDGILCFVNNESVLPTGLPTILP